MTYVVVGGGLAGLIAAYGLTENFPDREVRLLERSNEIGGLLAGKVYCNNSYFDFGTHIFQETGCRKLDALIKNAVPPEELIDFPVGEGDVSGVVFDGVFSAKSHFPSLIEKPIFTGIIEDIVAHALSTTNFPDINRTGFLRDVSKERFSKKYTDKILIPILERAFQIPAERLSGFAMLLPGLSRVICMKISDWEKHATHNGFREIVACPDQRILPEIYRHSRRSYYSRTHGSRAFVQGLAALLEKRGVVIETSSNIKNFDIDKGIISYTNNKEQMQNIAPFGVIIAVGAVGAARLLDINLDDFGFDKPMAHRVVKLHFR